ncbi:hypothetical protein [Streptomyces angustmyceticus]|uniref:hypothetical protein n=1 Tax=Streptomyces angustmyceticus TaxID=285578 RepID=UPI003D9092FD
MSLTSGLHCPRTPLRRFLDRELSAGPRPLRESYRSRHRGELLLPPRPGVGTEAGTVGTAIDYRLRLAFTTAAPVDPAALIGIEQAGGVGRAAGARMQAVGNELTVRLAEVVGNLDLANRELPMDRAQDEEEHLARLLIAAAWYQVNARTAIGFVFTPLAEAALSDPRAFTLCGLLELPSRDMVSDVVDQLHQAATGPLQALRAATRPEACTPGPTFPGTRITADADLIADGALIDFKSTRHPHTLRKVDAWQLLGYLLLDTTDQHRIDSVGFHLTRSDTLISWPVEEYLDLLGACRRDLAAFRAGFEELLHGCTADAEPRDQAETHRVERLLKRLTPQIPPGHCWVCAQPRSSSGQREYCSRWCSVRAQTYRKHGLLPGTDHPSGPVPEEPREI